MAHSVSIKKHLILTFCAKGWGVLLNLLLTPFYIKVLGIEAFGVIGISYSLQALLFVLDMGYGTTAVLETSRLSALQEKQTLSRFIRTGELLYWGCALFIFLFFYFCGDLFVTQSMSATLQGRDKASQLILLIGLFISSYWPGIFYSNALTGIHRQDLVNSLTLSVTTLRGAATFFLIERFPSLHTYFYCQIFFALLLTCMQAGVLWKNVGRWLLSAFDKALFIKAARHAFSMSLMMILGLLLMQMDKLVVSLLVPLAELGKYHFSWIWANGIYTVSGLILGVFFPKFSHYITLKDEPALIRTYHFAAQLVGIFTLSATAFFICFSHPILLLWCSDPNLVEQTALPASLLVMGSCINALYLSSYALQITHHLRKFTTLMHLAAVIALPPLIYIGIRTYGLVGASCAWPLLHTMLLLIYIPFTHRILLKTELRHFFLCNITKPLIGALCGALITKLLFANHLSPKTSFILLPLGALFTVLASFLCCKLSTCKMDALLKNATEISP